MDRKDILYAAVQIPLVVLSFWSWEFMAMSVAAAALYWTISIKKSGSKDYLVLSFSKSLSRACANKGVNHALAESLDCAAAPPDIKDLAVRSRLGDIDHAKSSQKAYQDPQIRELSEILALGLQSGMDISNGLRIFTSNLESEIKNRNRMLRNSLNMDVLSRIGMAFFVPLFGGIGTSIIGASGSIMGTDAALLKLSFEIILVIYIAVMSYVMNSFRHSSDTGSALAGSVQAAAIGTAIMRLSSSIIAYAI